MAQSRSVHALAWLAIDDEASISGVHDARTSIYALDPSASISPKPSDRTTVTLPLAAAW